MGNKCTEIINNNCLKRVSKQFQTKKQIKRKEPDINQQFNCPSIHSQNLNHIQVCEFRLSMIPNQSTLPIEYQTSQELKQLQKEAFNSLQKKQTIIKKMPKSNDQESIFYSQEEKPTIIKKKKSLNQKQNNSKGLKNISECYQKELMSGQLTKILATIQQTTQSSVVRLSTSSFTIQLTVGKARAGPIIVPQINYSIYR